MTNGGALPVHLTKGGNLALRTLDEELGSVTVILETTGAEGLTVDADVSVLLLGDDGRVRSNDDLIFYNQPVGLAGAVHLRDKIRTDDETAPVSSDVVTLELDDVPDDVERIVLSASLDPTLELTFAAASDVSMRISRSSDAQELVVFALGDLTTETALLFGEFYRRSGEWKVRAIGQGYDEGLAPLVTEFGIDVDPADDGGDDTARDHTAHDDTVHDDTAGDVAAPARSGDEALVVPGEDPGTGPEVPASEVEDSSSGAPRPSRVSVRRPTRAPKLPMDWDRTLPSDAESDWQPARLFPVAGIGGAEEQERRATSALLAVVRIVKEFGRTVASRMGARRPAPSRRSSRCRSVWTTRPTDRTASSV